MVAMKGVFYGVTLSLFAARTAPAWADSCADFRAQMTVVFAAQDRAEAEEGRVSHIRPPARTDATLCAAENKVIQEGHRGQFAADKKCFDSPGKYDQFKSSLDSLVSHHSKIAGLYHCPR
jgi:hypothetical protein